MKSRFSILTQNKFRWVLVAFLLPVFGVVAAFAPISPGDYRHLELKTSKVKTIVQEVALPLQVSSVAEFDAMSLEYMAKIEMLNRSQVAAKD